jgi:hypothetical protein
MPARISLVWAAEEVALKSMSCSMIFSDCLVIQNSICMEATLYPMSHAASFENMLMFQNLTSSVEYMTQAKPFPF